MISSYVFLYQWRLNGNTLAGATDSFYVAMQAGTYSVRITDSIVVAASQAECVANVNP